MLCDRVGGGELYNDADTPLPANNSSNNHRTTPPMYNLMMGDLSPRGKRRRSPPLKSSLTQAARIYGQQPYTVDDGGRSPRGSRARSSSTVRATSRGGRSSPRPHAPEVQCGWRRVSSRESLPALQQAEASTTDENASREQAAPAEPQEQCVVPSLVPNGAAPAPVAAAGPWAVAIGQIGSTLYQVAESSWNDDADEEHDEQQDEQQCHREVAAMTVVAADNADDEHAMQRAEPARPDSPGLVGPGKVSAYEMPAGLAVPRLEGSRTGGDVGVCSSVCSSKQLLWFSILHQAALLLLGFLGWLVSGCRPWLTLSSYLVVGVGLWVTHWAGHRRWVSPAWFDFHTIGHHVRPICTPTTAAAVAVARPAVSQC